MENETAVGNEMEVRFKRLSDTARVPKRGSTQAAAYDLYADEERLILPGATEKIQTGIALEIPKGYFGAIYARSGLAVNRGLRPANCVGIVDSDFRGNIVVALRNDNQETYDVVIGERIAQLIIQPYMAVRFTEVTELGKTERGNGGFGSTGSGRSECESKNGSPSKLLVHATEVN